MKILCPSCQRSIALAEIPAAMDAMARHQGDPGITLMVPKA